MSAISTAAVSFARSLRGEVCFSLVLLCCFAGALEPAGKARSTMSKEIYGFYDDGIGIHDVAAGRFPAELPVVVLDPHPWT